MPHGPIPPESSGPPVVIAGEVEVKNDAGNPVPVSGTVDIGTIPEVEVKNDLGNPVGVIGPLTDTELRATPVPVSGTVSVTEPVSIDDNGGSITVDGAVNVTNVTPVLERKFDGANATGAGSITIPDGVISFGVTVSALGVSVTIGGPDGSPVSLFAGQSINHSADSGNTINGPITVTTTAGSVVNATWIKP